MTGAYGHSMASNYNMLLTAAGGVRARRRRPCGRASGDDGRLAEMRSRVNIEYSPCLDGDPDPGEVVWTWVPYEEDPAQGKDRPVVIIGRQGDQLLGDRLDVETTPRRGGDRCRVMGLGRPAQLRQDRALALSRSGKGAPRGCSARTSPFRRHRRRCAATAPRPVNACEQQVGLTAQFNGHRCT